MSQPWMMRFLLIFHVCAIVFGAQPVAAMDVAPRISDREIIQDLAILKAGQEMNRQRFDDVNKRFDDVNKRFDDVNKRFDDVNRRIDDVREEIISFRQTMIVMFLGILTTLLSFVGFILWDRRTMLKPLEERINQMEKRLDDAEQKNHVVFEYDHPDGPLPLRIKHVLKELARSNETWAGVLRHFSL